MLLASSVNTPIRNSRFHLRLRVASRPAWIGPKRQCRLVGGMYLHAEQ